MQNIAIARSEVAVDNYLVSEINRLQQELDLVKQRLRFAEKKNTFEDIAGSDPDFLAVVQKAKSAAITPASILLEGEKGTGKSLLAQAIHNASRRWSQKLVMVNCAEMDGSFESELPRAFEAANRGTLYLANIDILPQGIQCVLLREMKKTEVRLICSTEVDLVKMVADGSYAGELFDRISVFRLKIPPLRERKDDIRFIAGYFISYMNSLFDKRICCIEPEAVEMLKEQEWPGNVGELKSLFSKIIMNMDDNHTEIKRMHLYSGQTSEPEIGVRLDDAVNEAERKIIAAALVRNNGDKNSAAAELDIPLRTLYYKCKRLGIA